jgi:hypothetical protein
MHTSRSDSGNILRHRQSCDKRHERTSSSTAQAMPGTELFRAFGCDHRRPPVSLPSRSWLWVRVGSEKRVAPVTEEEEVASFRTNLWLICHTLREEILD